MEKTVVFVWSIRRSKVWVNIITMIPNLGGTVAFFDIRDCTRFICRIARVSCGPEAVIQLSNIKKKRRLESLFREPQVAAPKTISSSLARVSNCQGAETCRSRLSKSLSRRHLCRRGRYPNFQNYVLQMNTWTSTYAVSAQVV